MFHITQFDRLSGLFIIRNVSPLLTYLIISDIHPEAIAATVIASAARRLDHPPAIVLARRLEPVELTNALVDGQVPTIRRGAITLEMCTIACAVGRYQAGP